MSRLISPSTPLARWARFDVAAIARGVLPPPLALPWSTAWSWLAAGPGHWINRAIDVVGALVGLVVFAPVLLAIALLIRLDSAAPVLFRQMRRGYRTKGVRNRLLASTKGVRNRLLKFDLRMSNKRGKKGWQKLRLGP
jgi:hypothetical protein